MKTRTFVITLILVLVVLIIIGSLATASDIESFWQAIGGGDVAEVKRLIEDGVDVSDKDNDGFTALMYALLKVHSEIAKLLIEAEKRMSTLRPILEPQH